MKKRFHGSGRPAGAVAADCSKQAQNNSALLPPTYYVDKPFQCIDCGKEEVWTAEQQKWFYEVAKEICVPQQYGVENVATESRTKKRFSGNRCSVRNSETG